MKSAGNKGFLNNTTPQLQPNKEARSLKVGWFVLELKSRNIT